MPQPNGQLATSRYAQTPVAVYRARTGQEVAYLLLRRPQRAPIQSSHKVVSGDRLDLIADQAYDDPTQFWRICDANLALWPEDLTGTIGRSLAIPSPFGDQG